MHILAEIDEAIDMFTFIVIPVLHFKAWVFLSLNYNRKNLQTGVERVSLTLQKSSNSRIIHFNTRLQTDSLSVNKKSATNVHAGSERHSSLCFCHNFFIFVRCS